MADPIKCFFVEPTERGRIVLRRYVGDIKCRGEGGMSYHDARVTICDVNLIDGKGEGRPATLKERTDERWPISCNVCDYRFADIDTWQHNTHVLWAIQDGGDVPDDIGLWTMHDLPVGAIWNAHWMGDHYRGSDGLCLVVKTPGGDWMIDGPSRSNGKTGPGWTRTGTPPNITVRPSIGMGQPGSPRYYHAFLTDGVLVPC